ncbi:hypothetical protein KI688_008078 [Linnemannia hyalina]|uniref:Ras-domain-containing protein n=1 Tax=Linnemannia hyalina TaxID=64524 RepID=A0A9P8BW64_9FUNG|nr:hypothetical protein KI688_008078 [Linnemannia hyalina]
MHGQEHQQEQSPPPLSSSPSSSASAKFASIIRRHRRQQQEPSSTSQQQQQHQQQQTRQQQSAKSLVNVLLTGTLQGKRNKSHIFKGKDKEGRQKEQQHQQEQDQQLQVNEKNRSDFQQHQQKEIKREIATTTARTSTTSTTMCGKDDVGIVEVSSPHEEQPWHQELSALSPTMQQEKKWHEHEGKKEEQSMDGDAFVSERVRTRIKKMSGLSSSLTLPSFLFKNGDRGLRQRQGLPTPTGDPSQIINTDADNDGRALVSLTDTAKATATAARDRGASTTATRSRRKNKGFLFFSSVLPATAGAAKRRSSHGDLIVDSPLSSPIATMSTTHSAAAAAISPRSHSLASSSFPPFLSNNIINDNDNDFSFFYPSSSSPPSSSPNDDTDDVEAQRSRLNAIRYSWYEQFQSAGDPALIPSSTLPSHKEVQRSNTADPATTSTDNNVVISKNPSQYTDNTTFTSTTSGTTPTNSSRLRSSGYDQSRNSRASSAFLDQETTRTWRGLLASVRQLSHDTSTTGSSTHTSASATSLSSSAQSFNEKDQRQSRKTKHDSHQSQHRESRRHSKHRNSDDASTIRAIGSFFARRPSFSSQHKVTTATASSSTIDLEKRAMMTKSPPRKLTILVVGDGAVGKSALTLRFLRDQFSNEYDPTIEDSYCKHIEVDGQDYTLELTDTAGQSEYRDQWDDHFMRTGDGFICVYSIASMSSFQELVGVRDQIWRAKGSRRVPIVITGNKCDLEDGGERQVHTDVGALFAERSNALFVETRLVNSSERLNVLESGQDTATAISTATTITTTTAPTAK